jgi:hypothetical protein
MSMSFEERFEFEYGVKTLSFITFRPEFYEWAGSLSEPFFKATLLAAFTSSARPLVLKDPISYVTC